MADIQGHQARHEQLKRTQKSRSPRVKELTAARDAAATAVDPERPWHWVHRSAGRVRQVDQGRRRPDRRLAAWPKNRPPPSSSTVHWSRRCSPRNHGCGQSPTTSTRGGAALGRSSYPAGRGETPTAGRTGQKDDQPDRSDRPRQWGFDLAANAQSLANADVQSAQRAYSRRGGNDTGALIGGIIISDLLSGGMRGGFGGGWIPTSFGGSPVRRRLHGRRRAVLNPHLTYMKITRRRFRGRVFLRTAVRAAHGTGYQSPP